MADDSRTALKQFRWHAGLGALWLLFVLLPTLLVPQGKASALAEATIGPRAASFLSYCPDAILVEHFQTYPFALLAVLFLVWRAHSALRDLRNEPRRYARALLTSSLQFASFLTFSAAVAFVVSNLHSGADLQTQFTWSARLTSFNALLALPLLTLVFALATVCARYRWVVLASVAVALTQFVGSLFLVRHGYGVWMPSQWREQLLSGTATISDAGLPLLAWTLPGLIGIGFTLIQGLQSTARKADLCEA